MAQLPRLPAEEPALVIPEDAPGLPAIEEQEHGPLLGGKEPMFSLIRLLAVIATPPCPPPQLVVLASGSPLSPARQKSKDLEGVVATFLATHAHAQGPDKGGATSLTSHGVQAEDEPWRISPGQTPANTHMSYNIALAHMLCLS